MAPYALPVVIVGGGPAGAAAAVGLARRGMRAVVLEASAGPQAKVGECLPPAANPLLADVGLSRHFDGGGHLPSHGNRSAWGGPRPVDRDFVFGPYGAGWHLDRGAFEAALAEAARAAGAEWRYGCRAAIAGKRGGVWELDIEAPAGQERLSACFLIDASGRPARLASRLRVRRVHYDRLVGVTAVLAAGAGSPPAGSYTLVEAVPSGWWYTARHPGGDLSATFMTDADLAKGAADPGGWQGNLSRAEHTARRASGRTPLAPPRVVLADTSRLEAFAGEGWLAAGDAAAAYDPLASYGITAALGSGLHAAEAAAGALAGRTGALPEYVDILGRAFRDCLAGLGERYALERRWTGETFWHRRHGEDAAGRREPGLPAG